MRLSRDLQVPCVTCRGMQKGKVLSGKKPPMGETAGDLKNLWGLFGGQVGPKAARTPTQPHKWLLQCKVEGMSQLRFLSLHSAGLSMRLLLLDH